VRLIAEEQGTAMTVAKYQVFQERADGQIYYRNMGRSIGKQKTTRFNIVIRNMEKVAAHTRAVKLVICNKPCKRMTLRLNVWWWRERQG